MTEYAHLCLAQVGVVSLYAMITAQGTTSAIFSDGAKMHRQIFH